MLKKFTQVPYGRSYHLIIATKKLLPAISQTGEQALFTQKSRDRMIKYLSKSFNSQLETLLNEKIKYLNETPIEATESREKAVSDCLTELQDIYSFELQYNKDPETKDTDLRKLESAVALMASGIKNYDRTKKSMLTVFSDDNTMLFQAIHQTYRKTLKELTKGLIPEKIFNLTLEVATLQPIKQPAISGLELCYPQH